MALQVTFDDSEIEALMNHYIEHKLGLPYVASNYTFTTTRKDKKTTCELSMVTPEELAAANSGEPVAADENSVFDG